MAFASCRGKKWVKTPVSIERPVKIWSPLRSRLYFSKADRSSQHIRSRNTSSNIQASTFGTAFHQLLWRQGIKAPGGIPATRASWVKHCTHSFARKSWMQEGQGLKSSNEFASGLREQKLISYWAVASFSNPKVTLFYLEGKTGITFPPEVVRTHPFPISHCNFIFFPKLKGI